MKLFFIAPILFIKLKFFPDHDLLVWMGIAIMLDFLTGVAKAVVLKKARTSSGFRMTIIKFMQYAGSLAAGIIISNAAKDNGFVDVGKLAGYFNEGLIVFIIYIEVTSVFENLYAVDNTSAFARFFINPIYRILTVQLGKLSRVADAAEAETKKTQI